MAASNEPSADDNASDDQSNKWTIRSTPHDYGILPTIGVSLWMGSLGFPIYIFLYLSFFAGTIARTIVLGLCILSLLLPRDFPRIGYRLGNWSMRCAERYFGLTTIIEDEAALEEAHKDKALIFAFEPHDVLPYPVFCFNPTLNRLPGKLGEENACLMTSAIFYVPIMRQIFTWARGQPIDKATFRGRLERKESFAFIPGGVQECTSLDPQRPDDIVLYLKRRKGFIRHALATGSPIVPVFGFNIDGSFTFWVPKGDFITRIARQIGFLPMFFFGRFGLPFGIPHPQKLTVVIGKPIDLPCQGSNVKEETVEKYHAEFLEEMEALFERHKVKEGYGHRTLKII